MTGRIPVTVIGGYLGAGKTTLVNHLLRHAGGLRLAVMVNDFGALPIDADLIEARDETLMSIAGGCVCCSFGSDMIDALVRMAAIKPDHVLIETSGVALPGPVAGTVSLLAPYEVDCVAVLADATHVQRLARDRYVGDTITRQLADAQIVLMTKADLAGEAAGAETLTWLAQQAPQAQCIAIKEGVVDPAVLIGTRLGYRAALRLKPHPDAAALYATESLPLPDRMDIAALEAALVSEPDYLRAKGFVRNIDGQIYSVQAVGSQVRIERHEGAAPEWIGLVMIGLRARWNSRVLRDSLGALAVTPG